MRIFRIIFLIASVVFAAAGCSRHEMKAVYPDRQLYPVAGIDISAHNGTVDFDAVKADGYDFVIIKATE
ncbi:MAG: hypothetical protein K2H98_05535, partial [Duncaniella sp.]|nr:hypothetical protein [Duncaniella sp.]